MTIHRLKCWPHAFDAIASGAKRFDYRSEADRDFAVGDTLILCKWDPSVKPKGAFGRGAYITAEGLPWHTDDIAEQAHMRVSYILHGGRFGVPIGYCVMSLELP